MEVPGLGQSLERLVDEVKVERGDGVPGTAESVADAEFLVFAHRQGLVVARSAAAVEHGYASGGR